jgi:sugar/nucleoside kinase (ribokinase family)
LAKSYRTIREKHHKEKCIFIYFLRYNPAMPTTFSVPLSEIVCLGVIVVDIVGAPIDALPASGTLEIIERLEMHIGGNAANSADALAKLGVSVGLIGGIGQDAFGDYVAAALTSHGVDMSRVVQDPKAGTAASFVVVDKAAQRSFLHVPGANATFTGEQVVEESLQGVRILHVAGLQLMTQLEGEPIARLLQKAQQQKIITVLDTVMNPRSQGWAGLAPALPYLNWFAPSIDEAIWLTGEEEKPAIVDKLRQAGATNIVLKDGVHGCFVYPIAAPEFPEFHVPVFPVQAVDTLGAGDSWSAGFCLGLLRDWDLEKTVRFANAVGATCVEAFGATTGILSEAATQARFGLQE